MITLTPLSSSAGSSSNSEPLCFLLEIDHARVLLDLGQADYRVSSIQSTFHYEAQVRALAPSLSLVLLSHSSSRYLSLYPYARARWGLQCPVYATQPTVEMGRVVCLAEVESWRSEHAVDDGHDTLVELNDKDKGKRPLRGPFVPTVEQVHEAFDAIKAVRYNQPLHLEGNLSHLLLTPFRSGHTLGGTLFKIRSPTSGTVLYAVGMNHTGERHLDGLVSGAGGSAGYEEGLLRPDLLIVEGSRATVVNPKRRERETALLNLVTSTLESQRSLLMPVDPSPRLLELLVLLDQHWTYKQIPPDKRHHIYVSQSDANQAWPYPLCLVSRTAQDMVAFARSLIEWMGGVVKEAEGEDVVDALQGGGKRGRRRILPGQGADYGPLDFRHVKFFSSPMDLLQKQGLGKPKLVLAIPPSMTFGPSRWLFTAMGGVEGNVILLTSLGDDGSLSKDLYDRWSLSQDPAARWGQGKLGRPSQLSGSMTLELNSKVPLIGAELETHLEAERMEKEREAAHQAAIDRSKRMLEADDLDSESESESESADEQAADGIVIRPGRGGAEGANAYAGDADNAGLTMSFDIFVKGQQMRTGRGAEMARFRMFPFIERRGRKVDDYGEGLDIGQWIRKGKEIEEEGETEEVREAKRRKEEEEERQKEPPEPPSKYITETMTVDMKAMVFFVDMEGQLDGQAIKTVITDLQPRKLIIVRSTREATENLVEYLQSSSSVTHDIHQPATDELVRIGEHVQSYSLLLGDTVSASLNGKWSTFEGFDITMVDGKIAFSAGSTVPHLESASAVLEPAPKAEQEQGPEQEVDSKPVLPPQIVNGGSEDVDVDMKPPMPSTDQADPSFPQPQDETSAHHAPLPLPSSLFVGDLRLAILKNKLAGMDIPAEFAGEGVLICGPGVLKTTEATGGSLVAVRKMAAGEIVLEGAVGKVYFQVRRALYGSLAQVVGV